MKERVWEKRYRTLKKKFDEVLLMAHQMSEENTRLWAEKGAANDLPNRPESGPSVSEVPETSGEPSQDSPPSGDGC